MRHVLVVDDQAAICELICTILEDTGEYRVSTAFSVEQALPLLDGDRPHLLVLDAVLPGAHGTELAARALERDIPIVIMTGEPAMEERLRQLGWPHLSKPFSMNQLAGEIRNAIDDSSTNLDIVRRSLDRAMNN